MWYHPGSKSLQWGSRCSHADLIYPFQLPEQRHPKGEFRFKTGKFLQGTGDKKSKSRQKRTWHCRMERNTG